MKPTLDFHSFADPDELAGHLAARVADLLRQAIKARGRATLVVSGGSTPKPLFRALARQALDWGRVTVTLADERWVDTTAPDSNEGLLRRYLLRDQAGAVKVVGLKNKAVTAKEGEEECAQRLAGLPRPFDVVILGMGGDGHTASFFPGARRLPEALDMKSGRDCLAISPPEAPHERMTLTLPVLLDSRRIILHITGPAKKKVLERALADGPATEMPIRAILRQQQTPLSVYWAP
ncbi:MAG: 6-phosphogluconolactonase [Proteobacteria bacterium]|nr:6-phosphogluconolactonase [Pseudomonadota bacterium]